MPPAAADPGPWNRYRLLHIVAGHPNADRRTLLVALDAVLTLLAEPDGRPYAAALALAKRPELTADEIRRTLDAPGASRRMRSGVRRRLAARRA
ncbi:MAG: hypothetical protein JXA67_00745 [Micromonosporaceae bacterium]|nr:hypothetical protein [Micromonosporaceae bacterium]